MDSRRALGHPGRGLFQLAVRHRRERRPRPLDTQRWPPAHFSVLLAVRGCADGRHRAARRDRQERGQGGGQDLDAVGLVDAGRPRLRPSWSVHHPRQRREPRRGPPRQVLDGNRRTEERAVGDDRCARVRHRRVRLRQTRRRAHPRLLHPLPPGRRKHHVRRPAPLRTILVSLFGGRAVAVVVGQLKAGVLLRLCPPPRRRPACAVCDKRSLTI
mmetsp:Transcript_22729/g.69868  ORF Transcript_22729/g.69868 Transcript_22729/m.69868 type:complete len:214 (+) Transcript_22729:438-1079(+)